MKTKTEAATPHFTSAVNFNRPWRKTDIVAGNLILNWHGQEIARVESSRMTAKETEETRDLIVRAVNAFDAAMRVVNLTALMKHTCTSKPTKVYACARCLAEIAQGRAEAH